MSFWVSRIGICIFAALLFAASATATTTWTPSPPAVAALEAKLRIEINRQANIKSLDQYARFYRGVRVQGHQVVRGQLIFAPPECFEPNHAEVGQYCITTKMPGVYINEEAPGDYVFGGGCDIVNLHYDPVTERLELRCNALR